MNFEAVDKRRSCRLFVYQIELMMDRFVAMQVFVEIAERGSLTEAGNALDMSRAMVSRYLESLEQVAGRALASSHDTPRECHGGRCGSLAWMSPGRGVDAGCQGDGRRAATGAGRPAADCGKRIIRAGLPG